MDVISELTRVFGINYIGCYSSHQQEEMFIYDPVGETPAIIHNGSIEEAPKQLRILNNGGQYHFVAIDFCLSNNNDAFKKANGKPEEKCDCIIYNNEVLYFIEIKHRNRRGTPKSITKALDQIEKTISIFLKENIDPKGTRQKVVAFVARRNFFDNNPLGFTAREGNKKALFKQKYGVEIQDSFEIILN